jgi:hypothetical protein
VAADDKFDRSSIAHQSQPPFGLTGDAIRGSRGNSIAFLDLAYRLLSFVTRTAGFDEPVPRPVTLWEDDALRTRREII